MGGEGTLRVGVGGILRHTSSGGQGRGEERGRGEGRAVRLPWRPPACTAAALCCMMVWCARLARADALRCVHLGGKAELKGVGRTQGGVREGGKVCMTVRGSCAHEKGAHVRGGEGVRGYASGAHAAQQHRCPFMNPIQAG